MKSFNFCPNCGTKLPGSGTGTEFHCDDCGEKWYRNPAPTAGCAIMRDDGKVLVSRRGIEPFKGMYDIVGGFISPGEDAVTALKREVKEETGLDVDVGIDDCVQIEPHLYGDDGQWTLAIGFLARWIGGEPVAADDVAELTWIDEDELDELDFAWPHDKELVRKAFAHGRS